MTASIRPLQPADVLRPFTCGNEDLDRFFRRFAANNQFTHHIGATYVAADGETILGFVTIAAASLSRDALPSRLRKGLPSYPPPALRLARLGIATAVQKQGGGAQLLRYVLGLAMELSDRAGCVGVVVDAKPESAGFYQRFGFMPLELLEGQAGGSPAPLSMFLPLADVRAALGGGSAAP
jgi:predicted N-acetyltransferase YhbS